MQRQLIILVPVVLIVWFLERSLWATLGQLLGNGFRTAFRSVVYIFGIAPVILAMFTQVLPEAIGDRISDYFYYHLLLIFFLFVVSLLVLGIVRLLQFVSGGTLLQQSWIPTAMTISTFVITFSLLGYGMVNAAYPQIKHYAFDIAKNAALPGMKIMAISDIHWETLANHNVIRRTVELINSREPDLVVILGDSVTMDSDIFIADGAPQLLGSIEATYGTYVITGNHDFYDGRVDQLMSAYSEAGIRVLRDEVTCIADSLLLVGREDIGGMRGLTMRERASLPSLLDQADIDQPVLVLDHQPLDIEENALLGIDLQLGGHTHGGQVWPITHFAEMLYELNHGLKTVGDAHFIITCGVGYWGPPVRLGTICEVLEIDLTFTGSSQ